MRSRFIQLDKNQKITSYIKRGAKWLDRYTAACDGLSRLILMGGVLGFIDPALNSSNPDIQMRVTCILGALALYVAPALSGLITAGDYEPIEEEERADLQEIIREAVGNEAYLQRIVREVIAQTQQEQAEQCTPTTEN